MPQQLNLNDPRFLPRRRSWTAVHGLCAAVGVLAATALGAQAMLWLAARTEADSRMLEAGMGGLRSQVARVSTMPSEAGNELAQLRLTEAGQRRIRAALDAGVVGNREGHASYLVALARQAPGNVWITGFQVSEDGNALSLEGRMANAKVLGDYLRRLNAEPRFKGRPFSQLQVRLLPPATGSNAPPVSEFLLRSQVGAVLPATAASAGGGGGGHGEVPMTLASADGSAAGAPP